MGYLTQNGLENISIPVAAKVLMIATPDNMVMMGAWGLVDTLKMPGVMKRFLISSMAGKLFFILLITNNSTFMPKLVLFITNFSYLKSTGIV